MVKKVVILEQQDNQYISFKQKIFAMNRRKSKKITKHITGIFQMSRSGIKFH